MYSAAAICRSTHLPIPQEGRIITSDDVFGHLPDIRCINGGIDAAPAPPLDGAGQCAGLPGVLSEAGGRLPLHPKTRRSRAARYFGLPDKEISSGAVVMRWPAIYNKGSKIREEAHPVAKHLDKFTQPFRDSPIPFALAEILTNGSGEMVDLVCRFLNPAAAALLGLSPEEVQGRRLSQLGPERALEQLAPMQAVAFSGSSASFPYVTAGGQTLTVTCYQVMYGTVACLLDPRSGAGAQSGALPELLPGADLELNREGLRCLACSRQLCQLTQWSRRALLDRGGRVFSALVAPADWPALLQKLLDAAREKRGVDHDFRLLRRDGGAVWVNLRAEILSTRQGATVFRGVFLDIDRLRREGQDLQAALSRRETALRDAETLLDRMPVGLCLLRRRPDGGVELLRANQVLSRLLGLSPAALARRLAEDPGSGLPTGEREELLAAAVRSRVGLASSGPHSNGFSLIRKVVEVAGADWNMPFDGATLADRAMEPTRIYVKQVLEVMKSVKIKGMAHITGGGLVENVPRVLPEGVQAVIDGKSWTRPAIFDWLQEKGNIDSHEMHRVFNNGIGLVVIVSAEDAEKARGAFEAQGEKVFTIGTVAKLPEGEAPCVVR